jgi:3-isopropylmalate/(R)-2-methylmalate dehydratase small subunit
VKLPMVEPGNGPRFLQHTGIAVPLLLCDLGCDVIAPLGTSSTSGLSAGERVFEGLRYLPGGAENPDFVINQEAYRQASILLAGDNFGIGDEPASAVNCLMAFGIRVVVASRFGSKFHGSCVSLGMLPVTLDEAVIAEIADWVVSNPSIEMMVDLDGQVIERPGREPVSFSVHPRARNKLLMGLDDLDEISQYSEFAAAFRNEDRMRRPWLYDQRE